MQTKRTYAVKLNVYDLAPVNDWTHGAGVGFYHSGVEVAGREWTFGSGSGSGTGVMEHRPQETGLPLRESTAACERSDSCSGRRRTAFSVRVSMF